MKPTSIRLQSIKLLLVLNCFAFSGFASADTLDTKSLEEALNQRDFQQVAKILITRPQQDPEALAWLRSHRDDWNPPLMIDLSFRLFSQLKVSPSKELVSELGITYARAKNGFLIEKSECVNRNRQIQNQTDAISLLDNLIMGNLRPTKAVVLGWAQDSLNWSKKLHSERKIPAATWLCGSENLRQENERMASRLKTQEEIAAQIKLLLEDPNIGN